MKVLRAYKLYLLQAFTGWWLLDVLDLPKTTLTFCEEYMEKWPND